MHKHRPFVLYLWCATVCISSIDSVTIGGNRTRILGVVVLLHCRLDVVTWCNHTSLRAQKSPADICAYSFCCWYYDFVFFTWNVAYGISAKRLLHQSPLEVHVGEVVTLEGMVSREPERHEKTLYLYVETGGDTLLVTTNLYSDSTYGQRVRVEGIIKVPETFTTDTGR